MSSSLWGEAYHVSTRPVRFHRFLSFWILFDLLFRFGRHLGICCGQRESRTMTEYIVGFRQGKRSEVLTIEAEDALIAALRVKHNHPEAIISYVRKSNRRGDRRHPHRKE